MSESFSYFFFVLFYIFLWLLCLILKMKIRSFKFGARVQHIFNVCCSCFQKKIHKKNEGRTENKIIIFSVSFFCVCMWALMRCLKKKNLSFLCCRRTKSGTKRHKTYSHSMEHMDNMTCRRAVRLKPNHVFSFVIRL